MDNQKKTGRIRSKNVTILNESFPMPQLLRSRRIWLYLPDGYFSSDKRYPVLYLQDGQNLFDETTAFVGDWGIDEILDSLNNAGHSGVIVVGIDNGGEKRNNEYNPYDNDKYGMGEGNSYVSFLIESLKPYIDKHLRTLPDKNNTGIGGSSMGGLISFYAWLIHPEVFGKAGVFSPSFWIAPQIADEIKLNEDHLSSKLFLIAGDSEDEFMVPDLENIYTILIENGMPKSNMQKAIVAGAGHCESYWHDEFEGVFLWLFSPNSKE